MRFRSLLATFVEDLIRGISGPGGICLRRAWYRYRLGLCGAGLIVEPGVHFLGAEHIELGDSVWIDRNVILIAGPPRKSVRIVNAGDYTGSVAGNLRIGSGTHVGIGTIIQAHGGVTISDCFTASAGVKIYSLSNDPVQCRLGTLAVSGSDPGYRLTPVEIGRNVWLGIDVTVVGHRIADDCFVLPKSLVTADIAANVVAGGAPARPIRPRFAD